jgi:putative transposase
MSRYRRFRVPGGTFFFTVNCARRRGHRLLVEHIALLGASMRAVKTAHPFRVDAIVVLPEHLPCVLTLPPGDTDYAMRWGLIKAGFSRVLPAEETRSASRLRRGERGIWQRCFWEHGIRDDLDFQRHVDYVHWNPVKHGWVTRVRDWPYSSFHRYVAQGLLTQDWAWESADDLDTGE